MKAQMISLTGRKKKKLERQVEKYLGALKSHRSDYKLHIELGDTYAELEDPRKSVAAYYDAINLLRQTPNAAKTRTMVIELYEKIIQMAPQDAKAYLELGEEYVTAGQKEKAFRFLLASAKKAYEEENYEVALQCYNQVIAKGRTNPHIVERCTELYVKLGRKEEAMQNYIKIGDMYAQDEKNIEALEYYKKACLLDQENPELLLKVARMYNAMAWTENAASELVKVGEIFEHKQDYTEAIRYYQYSIRLDPENEKAHEGRKRISESFPADGLAMADLGIAAEPEAIAEEEGIAPDNLSDMTDIEETLESPGESSSFGEFEVTSLGEPTITLEGADQSAIPYDETAHADLETIQFSEDGRTLDFAPLSEHSEAESPPLDSENTLLVLNDEEEPASSMDFFPAAHTDTETLLDQGDAPLADFGFSQAADFTPLGNDFSGDFDQEVNIPGILTLDEEETGHDVGGATPVHEPEVLSNDSDTLFMLEDEAEPDSGGRWSGQASAELFIRDAHALPSASPESLGQSSASAAPISLEDWIIDLKEDELVELALEEALREQDTKEEDWGQLFGIPTPPPAEPAWEGEQLSLPASSVHAQNGQTEQYANTDLETIFLPSEESFSEPGFETPFTAHPEQFEQPPFVPENMEPGQEPQSFQQGFEEFILTEDATPSEQAEEEGFFPTSNLPQEEAEATLPEQPEDATFPEMTLVEEAGETTLPEQPEDTLFPDLNPPEEEAEASATTDEELRQLLNVYLEGQEPVQTEPVAGEDVTAVEESQAAPAADELIMEIETDSASDMDAFLQRETTEEEHIGVPFGAEPQTERLSDEGAFGEAFEEEALIDVAIESPEGTEDDLLAFIRAEGGAAQEPETEQRYVLESESMETQVFTGAAEMSASELQETSQEPEPEAEEQLFPDMGEQTDDAAESKPGEFFGATDQTEQFGSEPHEEEEVVSFLEDAATPIPPTEASLSAPEEADEILSFLEEAEDTLGLQAEAQPAQPERGTMPMAEVPPVSTESPFTADIMNLHRRIEDLELQLERTEEEKYFLQERFTAQISQHKAHEETLQREIADVYKDKEELEKRLQKTATGIIVSRKMAEPQETVEIPEAAPLPEPPKMITPLEQSAEEGRKPEKIAKSGHFDDERYAALLAKIESKKTSLQAHLHDILKHREENGRFLTQELQTLNATKQRLQQNLEYIQKVKGQLEHRINTELQEAKLEIQSLTRTSQTLEAKLAAQQQSEQQLRKQLRMLTRDKELLQANYTKTVDALKQEKNTLEKQVQQASKDKATVEKALKKKLQAVHHSYQKIKAEYTAALETKEAQIAENAQQLSEFADKYVRLEKTLTEIRKERDKLNTMLLQETSTRETLEEKLIHIESQVDSLEVQGSKLLKQLGQELDRHFRVEQGVADKFQLSMDELEGLLALQEAEIHSLEAL